MKKFLPIIFVLLLYCLASISPGIISAQVPTVSVLPAAQWVEDPEVTFIGKNAARSGYVLNWTLLNYQWSCVTKVDQRNCNNNGNPLQEFWKTIVAYIVMPLLILVILATSMVIIITRGRSLKIMRFLPRFIAVLLLIALSYSLLQFLYQFFDMIQGFFLRVPEVPGAPPPPQPDSCPPNCISNHDLLYVGWNYQDFIGLRLLGNSNMESAFISLLLTKLTALTYFVMVGILLIRKIILWFFIIVSPVFPILLLFYPVRNTGKIWIGEFFRWLLYGPLFAIFLQGLVFMWKWRGVGGIGGSGGGGGIPLQFILPTDQRLGNASEIIYPTAVNILLGGPQQYVQLTNSVNLTETFMLYVIALIMLWIVILLPWILLQIFLDYAASFAGDSTGMKALVNLVSNKMVPPPSPVGYPPPAPQPAGAAMSIPFTKRTVNIPVSTMPAGQAREIIRDTQITGVSRAFSIPFAQISSEVVSLANIPLPTMKDVARYETALVSNNANQKQEIYRMQQTLEKIANPALAISTIERDRYTNMKERLEKESQQGNPIATTILNAVNTVSGNQSGRSIQISNSELRNVLQQAANPVSVPNIVDRERMTKLHEMLSRESKENNSQLASSILSVTSQTSAGEIERIREQLTQSQQQGNIMNAVSVSAVTNALSSAASQPQSMTQIRTVLQQIANPASVSNVVDRERMSNLHEMLSKESRENNNQLATSILSVSDKTTATELDKIKDQLVKEQALENSVASTVTNTIKATQIKNVLQQIASPSSVTNATEREKFLKLHDMLSRESKENNNELASSILKVNETTALSELEKIQEKLRESNESVISSQVLSVISNSVRDSRSSTIVKSVLQQIANPASASTIDRQKISRLHEALTKESQKGNQLATSILGVSTTTSASDIQKLREKLREAKEKGQPLAIDILEITSQQASVNIPSTNRIQTVTPQELQEVKQMWKENYQNMEVPEGMAGTRTQWIQDDAEKIGNLIALLTSQDPEKVNQGFSEVGSILPFLLVGGFSKSEIVSYLQAKQEAAREVLQSITSEEETKVTVETRKEEAVQTMSANMEAPAISIPTPSFEAINIVTPQVSNEILTMVNLKIPRMRDIARFETMNLNRDKSQTTEVQKTREVLENLALPSKIQIQVEREKIERLRERLIEESRKGNSTADLILVATSALAQKFGEITATTAEIKTVLQQIASPDLSPLDDREFYTRLHDYLLKESKENNNELATKILSATGETGASDIESIKSRLLKEQKENKVASGVISSVNRHVELKQMRNMLSQIANPAAITSPTNKERFNRLNEQLSKAGKTGDKLALSILEVKLTTKTKDIENLKKDLSDAVRRDNKLAKAILSAASSSIAPSDNTVQEVTEKDYEEIRKMWEENYRTLPVPFGFSDDKKGRIEWIDKEIVEISATINLLIDSDSEKKNEGLKKVGTILPFLLLGGFSHQEIVTYLNVKLEAGQTVITELKSGEEKEEKVDVKTRTEEKVKTLAAAEEEK